MSGVINTLQPFPLSNQQNFTSVSRPMPKFPSNRFLQLHNRSQQDFTV